MIMIAILMATYNGSRYLREQIDSILSQTNDNWQLYIHDDGSTDSTMDIILEYCNKYIGKIVYLNDAQKHRGAAMSFMYLLKQVEADYYMFCDQDDVWLPNKVEQEFKSITEYSNEKPILVFSDLYIVDEKLNVIEKSYWRYMRFFDIIYSNNNVNLLKTVNYVTGCTVMFNRNCRDLAINIDCNYIDMHDSLVALCVVGSDGVLLPIAEPLLKYRQHDLNVVGARNVRLGIFDSLKFNYLRYKMSNCVCRFNFIAFIYYRCLFFFKKYVLL